MSEDYRITADLFMLPYRDGNHILYAPRLGFACIANPDLVNLLASLDDLSPEALSQQQKAALEFLNERGIFDASKEASCVKAIPEKYAPTQVTLFPTNQCNMRCRYCYASAGERKAMVMDWHYATSAVERVIENLKAKAGKQLMLGFHGGGEPLYPWQFIRKIVAYAEGRCAREGLTLAAFSATNGILSVKQLEWIVQHFVNLNISFDGLPRVQDYHRPLANGKGSFEFVDRTLRFLDEHHFRYGIRSTISSYNVDLMEESLDFIGQNYRVKAVHFEPLFYCGRCKTDSGLSPDLERFSRNFQSCQKKSASYQIALTYSGCKIENLTSSFCGVSCDNFSVTPDGYVTTCYEVTSREEPKSDTFFIGTIGQEGTLDIDEQKRRFLHSLTVDHLAYCQDCFAKWHCGGECAAKLEDQGYTGPRGNDRCLLNRELIRNRLIGLVEGTYYNPAMRNCTQDQTGMSETGIPAVQQ